MSQVTLCLTFLFPFRPEWSQAVHVFVARRWRGQPRESWEMAPPSPGMMLAVLAWMVLPTRVGATWYRDSPPPPPPGPATLATLLETVLAWRVASLSYRLSPPPP